MFDPRYKGKGGGANNGKNGGDKGDGKGGRGRGKKLLKDRNGYQNDNSSSGNNSNNGDKAGNGFGLPLLAPNTLDSINLSNNLINIRPNTSNMNNFNNLNNLSNMNNLGSLNNFGNMNNFNNVHTDENISKTSMAGTYGSPESLLSINTASTSPFNSLLTPIPNPLQRLASSNENNNRNQKRESEDKGRRRSDENENGNEDERKGGTGGGEGNEEEGNQLNQIRELNSLNQINQLNQLNQLNHSLNGLNGLNGFNGLGNGLHGLNSGLGGLNGLNPGLGNGIHGGLGNNLNTGLNTGLAGPDSWLNTLQLSHRNFKSTAVNMEYSVLSKIINTTGTSPNRGIDGVGAGYSPSLSSSTGGDSPLFLSRAGDLYDNSYFGLNVGGGNSHSNGFNSDRKVFCLNNLNQYALGVKYQVPASINGILDDLNPLNLNDSANPNSINSNSYTDDILLSNQGQSLPDIIDMIDALKQVQYSQRQQQAIATGTQHLWMVPGMDEDDEANGPKRLLSFTISTKLRTPQNTRVQTPMSNDGNGNGKGNSSSSSSSITTKRNQRGVLGMGVGSGTGMSAGSGIERKSLGGHGGDGYDDDSWIFRKFSEPAEIYANVRQPYSYTPAYHQLTIYIRTRFQRDQQLRIAKSMAAYRPSFIACTNTLKEDDLIFMEQCFQRTLLEYEKFIAYSGTPTAVWRRTGQVAAVGTEFCVLTGWPRERLLNEHTFIVELMDDNSVVEYFEMFSKMAFGDSRGANMSECTLLTPQGKKIKTTSIWTLKRDVFGIPMMIVGNFLPFLL